MSRHLTIAGTSALAAGLAGLAAWALLAPEPPEPVLRVSLNTSGDDFPAEWIALSPDGTVMVSSHPDDAGGWGLWVRRFSTLGETRIPNVSEQVNDPIISSDGTEVAFFDNGVLKVAREQDCRVILTGDTRQHASVERGDALRVLEENGGISPIEITKIQRQRVHDRPEPETIRQYRQAVRSLSEGDPARGCAIVARWQYPWSLRDSR